MSLLLTQSGHAVGQLYDIFLTRHKIGLRSNSLHTGWIISPDGSRTLAKEGSELWSKAIQVRSSQQNWLPMSALGHKQTCAVQKGMSALPPKATSNATLDCPLRANSGNRSNYGRSGK